MGLLRAISVYLFVFVSLFSSSVFAKNLSELSDGPASYTLPKSQLESVTAYRLKNPKLLWVNVPLLRKMGFNIDDPPTPKQQRELLDALAWVIKDKNLDPKSITDETKEFFVDYYGGINIGNNQGSGRAIMRGFVQMSGAGRTMMADNGKDMTGRRDLLGALLNAVWGEATTQELPYGGNQIIALIDRGTRGEDGSIETMDVRLAPVRAGHMMPNAPLSAGGSHAQVMVELPINLNQYDKAGIARAKLMLKELKKLLPLPKKMNREKMSELEVIAAGVAEYMYRLGVQLSTMDVKRMYHGALTESNVQLNGKLLDFATSSTQPGYQSIFTLTRGERFGEYRRTRTYLIYRFTKFIEALIVDEKPEAKQELNRLAREMGSSKFEFLGNNYFERGESDGRDSAMLWSLGIPDGWIKNLSKKHEQFLYFLGMQYSRNMQEGEVNLEHEGDIFAGHKESFFKRFSRAINQSDDWSEKKIKKILESFGDDVMNGEHFVSDIVEFFKDLKAYAKKQGWSAAQLLKYMRLASEFRNRPMEDLYAPNMRQMVRELERQADKLSFEQFGAEIDKVIANSVRTTPNLEESQAPLRVTKDKKGFKIEVVDVLTNKKEWLPLHASVCDRALK